MNETYEKDKIICPHCGHEYTDLFEMVEYEEDASTENECERCGKPFTTTCESVNYWFRSTTKPEGEGKS